jgi:cell division protein FtsB
MRLNAKNRLAFLLGRQSGIRSTSDAVDQLQAQHVTERGKVAALHREVEALVKEIAKMQVEICRRDVELAQRDTADAFAAAPSQSAAVH